MRNRWASSALLLLACCGERGRTQTDVATDGCRARYDAIQRWILANGRMPGTEGELYAAARRAEKDPWGNQYVIEKDGARILVWSWGPDGVEGTDDDISYPPVE